MKKIAILINSNKLGGAEKTVHTIIDELYKDFDVHLITIEKNEFFKSNSKVHVFSLSHDHGGKNKIHKLLDLIPLGIKLKKYLTKHQIKIVQSNLFRANYVNILAKVFGSQHHVQIVDHTLSARLLTEGISGRINLALIKFLYPLSDVSISVSENVREQLKLFVKLPIQNMVINNPFDIENIVTQSMEEIDDFMFKKDIFYIIIVGRINSIKNYELIIEALNVLNNNIINLLIIGKEENITVSSLLEKTYAKEAIHYLGPKDNPFKYIRKSDLLIVSSNSESFGNVLVESMICDTPVISSDCGGPREILAPSLDASCTIDEVYYGEYGILFPVGDTHCLINAISKIFEDYQMKLKYSIVTKKRINDFSKKLIIDKYKKVLSVI